MQDQFIFIRVQGPQIDIQDKNQLSMLRQQLEEQKRQKEAGGNTISEEKTTTTDGKENYLTIYYTLAIHRNNYIKLAENMHAIDIAARSDCPQRCRNGARLYLHCVRRLQIFLAFTSVKQPLG